MENIDEMQVNENIKVRIIKTKTYHCVIELVCIKCNEIMETEDNVSECPECGITQHVMLR